MGLEGRTSRPGIDPTLRATALKLSRRDGVIGVFLGRGTRKGRWLTEKCVVVHVARKLHALHLSKRQTLPRYIGPYRVDVIEVGYPRTHALDISDQVAAPGARPRTGTLTLLINGTHGGIALLSGHVALPLKNGLIVGNYDNRDDPVASISVVDGTSNQQYSGNILRGGISARSDWSLALFSTAAGDHVDTVHPLVEESPPLRLRGNPLSAGDSLRHFSRVLGRELQGRFVHEALSPVDIVLGDGSRRRYSGLQVVAGTGGAFSRGGDSGSLVCDTARRVVGTILAGGDDGSLSYMLPIDSFRFPLADNFYEFFRD